MSRSWATIGNLAHVVSLSIFMSFAFCVAFEPSLFDPSWRQWGFCVTNPTIPYWTSHDLCLYADLVLGAVLGMAYLLLHKAPGMEQANELVGVAVFGTIGHGIGHGAVAAGMRNQTEDLMEHGDDVIFKGFAYDSLADLVVMKLGPILLFWLAILKQVVPKASWSGVFGMALISVGLSSVVPQKFGFTYVQSVLNLASTANEMLRSKSQKGFQYAMYPIMVSIPLGIVGWIESTMCTKGVIDIGGHLIYDAYIPLGLLAFYILCYLRNPDSVPDTSPTGDKKKVA